MNEAVILADADNTLWDTDAVFADAQSRLLERVECATGQTAPVATEQRLAWLRGYDQAIAKVDHRHLRYPPALLVHALALGLAGTAPAEATATVTRGRAPETIADADVEAIVAAYFASVGCVPDLLPGVRQGLETAARKGVDIWVLSEGPAECQRARIATHGLDGLVRGVTEVTKNKEQFARQRRRFEPRIIYVVGDQPDRDIVPARAGGCRAVLVPSRFRPAWQRASAWCEADYVSASFDAAVSWIMLDLTA